MRRVLVAMMAAVVSATVVGAGQLQRPTETAHIYCVDSDDWRKTGGWSDADTCTFPERADLKERAAIGVAFSGGGTRSAAATLGALRGLRDNRWLEHIGYMTAVSGGAWTALPYVYSPHSDLTILGTDGPCSVQPEDKKNRIAAAIVCGKPGPIGDAIAQAVILRCGLEYFFDNNYLPSAAKNLAKTFGLQCGTAGPREGTFAKILGHLFLNKAICGDCGADILGAVAPPEPKRPYLILGGTAVEQNANWEFPRLLLVEITQDYAGIRQRVGHLGGAYVESWAYGRRPISVSATTATYLRDEPRVMTLEGALAITGSAPYLATLLNRRKEAALASRFFPHLGLWSTRNGAPTLWDGDVPHGDGGFTDNLGVLPLLARGVRNLLVFVNANNRADANSALVSLFQSIDGTKVDGDKSHNVVFAKDKLARLLTDLHRASATGPAVACYKNWETIANSYYNVRGSQIDQVTKEKIGVNICWVYNDQDVPWRDSQSQSVQAFMNAKGSGFDRFPWFRTFGEDIPYLTDMSVSQVATLSALAHWTVTQPDARDVIGSTLGLPSSGGH